MFSGGTPARAAADCRRRQASSALIPWMAMITPTALWIRALVFMTSDAFSACSRVVKDRSALATAPPAQAPKMPATASCCPSKACS